MTIINLDQIQNNDLIACTDDDGVTKSVTGAQFKGLFKDSLKLVSDVEWSFDALNNNAIKITKDATASGGVTPYKTSTKYNITIGNLIAKKSLPSRIPINAEILNGVLYMSFGVVSAFPTYGTYQDIWSFNPKTNTFAQVHVYDNEQTNNRYGFSKIKLNGKETLVDIYHANGTNQVEKVAIVQINEDGDVLKDSQLLPVENNYEDLIPKDGTAGLWSAVMGFSQNDAGETYFASYESGIYKVNNVSQDSNGFLKLKDGEGFDSNISYIARTYFNGFTVDPMSNSAFYSVGNNCWKLDLNTATATNLRTGLPSDVDKIVKFEFTKSYVLRTILGTDGSIEAVNYGTKAQNWSLRTTAPKDLYIKDPDGLYLFAIRQGKPIYKFDPNRTNDPFPNGQSAFDNNPYWLAYRWEPLPAGGDITGAAIISLEPFTFMWYQDGELRVWGNTPEPGTDATVTQTITDQDSVSVESSVTKVVP